MVVTGPKPRPKHKEKNLTIDKNSDMIESNDAEQDSFESLKLDDMLLSTSSDEDECTGANQQRFVERNINNSFILDVRSADSIETIN